MRNMTTIQDMSEAAVVLQDATMTATAIVPFGGDADTVSASPDLHTLPFQKLVDGFIPRYHAASRRLAEFKPWYMEMRERFLGGNGRRPAGWTQKFVIDGIQHEVGTWTKFCEAVDVNERTMRRLIADSNPATAVYGNKQKKAKTKQPSRKELASTMETVRAVNRSQERDIVSLVKRTATAKPTGDVTETFYIIRRISDGHIWAGYRFEAKLTVHSLTCFCNDAHGRPDSAEFDLKNKNGALHEMRKWFNRWHKEVEPKPKFDPCSYEWVKVDAAYVLTPVV